MAKSVQKLKTLAYACIPVQGITVLEISDFNFNFKKYRLLYYLKQILKKITKQNIIRFWLIVISS